MSQQQYPQQQPGWGGPQQQPGYGPPPWQPPPPKKSNAGKIIGFGCLGLVGLFVLLGIIGAIVGSGSDTDSSGSKPAASAPDDDKPAADDTPKGDDEKADEATKDDEPKKKVVTFKVWGTAPAGALGPLDITYGSDSDNRKGTFKDGKFEATLPLDEEALYFNVMAQLQGSGDINCSVTVDGETKKGHASGDYNICNAQLSSGLLGGWS